MCSSAFPGFLELWKFLNFANKELWDFIISAIAELCNSIISLRNGITVMDFITSIMGLHFFHYGNGIAFC